MVTLASCASAPRDDAEALAEYNKINDPIEPTNRFIFSFNQGLDKGIIKPVTSLYRALFPEVVRTGVHNFLNNLKTPVVLANDVLQGESERAGDTIIRFVINSTAGIAGFRDQAADWGWEPHDEDFGQTLAVWGVGEGPYIMLPLFGPSNPRDAIGKVVDFFLDPINWWAENSDNDWVPLTRTIISGIDTRDQLWDVLDDLKKSSIDFYAAIRSLYRQRRNEDISNGAGSKNNETPNFSDNFELDDPNDQPADSGVKNISGKNSGTEK
ncbi:MAG: VacJ family lipoprotein [Rhodospirillaceae bacterium]|nr:VacJ family lipoprotein [Rhodospirillaceae bacterium]